MNETSLGADLLDRLRDTASPHAVDGGPWLIIAMACGLALVSIPQLWRFVRILVTVVHELGHAMVGVAVGRRFTGFVVNTDMSGHTVTAGKSKGLGLVLTTAAGYPMPALVGAGMVAAGLSGWGRAIILVAAILFALAFIRARSWYTVVVLIALDAASIALWWRGEGDLIAAVVAGGGVTMLAGAWRQWVNVATRADRTQDPGMLAAMTHIPAVIWNAVFVLIICASTWWAVAMTLPLLT